MPLDKVTVRVPATSANLGPGFDCLGIALDIVNTLTLQRADQFRITITGEGARSLSQAPDNLVYKAVVAFHKAAGLPLPALALACHNDIPLTRGLGSSSAAVVAGLVAANELNDRALPLEALLRLAGDLEGHFDNVTPALLGGCQIVVKDQQHIVTSRVPVPAELKAVLFIPDFPISTQKARKVLPAEVSRSDAVYNIGRAALLVNALVTEHLEKLQVATQDHLHQPYRKSLFPQMDAIFQAALQTGAQGAFLSGSGSTILAFAQGKESEIGEAMRGTAKELGVNGKSLVCSISHHGAQVINGDQ